MSKIRRKTDKNKSKNELSRKWTSDIEIRDWNLLKQNWSCFYEKINNTDKNPRWPIKEHKTICIHSEYTINKQSNWQ